MDRTGFQPIPARLLAVFTPRPEPRPHARDRLEAELGPELTQRLLRVLVARRAA